MWGHISTPAIKTTCAWGLAMGMFNSCIYLGMMASSTTLGAFIGAVGYPAGFAAGGVAALATLALFLLLMRGRKRLQG